MSTTLSVTFRSVPLSVFLASTLAGVPLPVGAFPAQTLAGHPSGAVVPSDRDSVVRAEVLVRRARERQRAFERFRRRRLPRHRGGAGGACDEWLGRFRLSMTDDADDGDREPPPESERVRRRRSELVAYLDTVARRVPADGWVAGQRVRYLVEAGLGEESLEAARECRADPAWCAALEGYALHHLGRYGDAESAYGRALAGMERGEACRWSGLSVLYRGDPVEGEGPSSCRERVDVERRLWRLADPLYLTPGNERLTEHYSRHVVDRWHTDGAASAFGEPWGDDLRELTLRYGWPRAFEREELDGLHGGRRAAVVARYPEGALNYLPPGGATSVDGRPTWAGDGDGSTAGRVLPAPAGGWTLEPRCPRAAYAPGYLREEMLELPHLVSRFRRGDSTLVVAAWRFPRSRTLRGRTLAGLFVEPSTGPRRETVRELVGAVNPWGILSLAAPAGPAVLSLEAWAPEDSVAGRYRAGTHLAGIPSAGLALSDLLLLAPAGDTLQNRLPAVRDLALSRARRAPGERLGLYWEAYGADLPVRRLRTSVRLRRTGEGFFRKVGEFLGVAGDRDPVVEVEWRERADPGKTVHARSLVIHLPADLPQGEYRLSVTVTPSGGAPLVVERELRVVDGG